MVSKKTDFKTRPAMRDVAQAAGVSVAAVSKVIRNAYGVSPAMRGRVEKAIKELGYRPSVAARAMRGQTFTIGFEIPQLGNDFFIEVMNGSIQALAGTPYQLMIVTGGNDSSAEDVLNSLMDRRPDGIVAIAPNVSTEWLNEAAKQVPMVILGRHDVSEHRDSVKNDDHLGAELVMNHLIGLGHKNIAHLTLIRGSNDSEGSSPHVIRESVYQARMKALGLEPKVYACAPFEADAFEMVKNILATKPRPTAIFAGHDTLAMGALRAIWAKKLTTKDVSVVGYDDIYLAGNPSIALTTVNQFGAEMGRIAATLLLERVSGERTISKNQLVTPELVIRNTTHKA